MLFSVGAWVPFDSPRTPTDISLRDGLERLTHIKHAYSAVVTVKKYYMVSIDSIKLAVPDLPTARMCSICGLLCIVVTPASKLVRIYHPEWVDVMQELTVC